MVVIGVERGVSMNSPESVTVDVRSVFATSRMVLLCLALVGLAIFFHSTFESMVATWLRSETFTHGFLVLPVSAYLVWRKRRALARLSLKTDIRALLPLWILGFTWLLAYLTATLVVEQLAVVAMIPVLFWLFLGFPALQTLAFPLAFLVFAVPMGEQLVYPLMELTATFTVALLRLSGIPVYWEGTFFSIPSGNWSVVEACSGIRYLMASVFLGSLYAYFSYRSFWRRTVFIVLAFVIPILANGLRAYIIVMIGHLSDMKLAVGVDHLIYGWVFFGIVMFLLFFVGTLWREAPEADSRSVQSIIEPPQGTAESQRTVATVAASAVISLVLWPASAIYFDQPHDNFGELSIQAPEGEGLWKRAPNSFTDWKPQYQGFENALQQDYQRGDERIGLYLAVYGASEGELVNSQNVMVAQTDPVWRMPYQHRHEFTVDGTKYSVVESQIQSTKGKLLLWHWYWINGRHVSNDFFAKILEAVSTLSGSPHKEAGIVVYTEIDARPEYSRERLQLFLNEILPSIDESLRESFVSTRRLKSPP